MIDSIWFLRIAEGVVLIVGGWVAFASLRAYSRVHRPSLAFLGVGFLLVTVAAVLAGVLYEVVSHDLLTAWTVSATLDALGFGVILFSILGPTRPAPGSKTIPPESETSETVAPERVGAGPDDTPP